MAFWNRKTKEQRAESGTVQGMVQVDDPLLKALVGGGTVTREMALQVPTVSGGIDLIAGVVAGTPIKLYRDEGGKAVEVTDDVRLRLLNDETGDTLNANEFWRAMIADYYLGKGGFAYIHRQRGRPCSLHYVREEEVSLTQNSDPIFKSYNILVGGRMYYPFDFVKILRATRDGMRGVPITEESGRLIETAYSSLVFERNMVRRGGNKKGFLKSEKKLEQGALDKLREAFSRLYSNGDENSENFVVLNNGIDFKESSNTSVELQLNENKLTNAGEFAKIFHISTDAISGKAADTATLAKLAAIPLMKTIQCALNRDLLLENEKADYYFAFDTKELLRGDMAQRFAAYKTALEANFMQIDEIRYAEDLEPLGMNWIKLGLQDVLYDPKTGEVFAPNTGNRTNLSAAADREESPPETDPILPEPDAHDTMEERGNGENHTRDPKTGRFTGSRKKGAKQKTKYAPSPQRNKTGIQLPPKKYARLCGEFGTRYPGLKPEDGPRDICDAKSYYSVVADGFGGMIVVARYKIKDNGGSQ